MSTLRHTGKRRPGPSVYLSRLQLREELHGAKTNELLKEDTQKEADI